MKSKSRWLCRLALLGLVVFGAKTALPGWYLDSMKDTKILEIRGETADSTKLGKDRYIVDNLDYVLAHHEWVVVNFSAYWCGDSHSYFPDYQKAAALPEYSGIFWAYAEIDGTVGNENFRSRFNLPGIPVTILFHSAQIIDAPDSTKSVLDGHDGDKTFDDLIVMLKKFYPTPQKSK